MADHQHSHSHAPGDHSHSHEHGPSASPQSPQFPPTDPAAQALIDSDFQPVALALHPDMHTAVCSEHKLEKCEGCGVDFVNTNRLSKILVANPGLLCPPPANVVNQKLSQMVQSAKEEGNALFKSGQSAQALTRYTGAASLAVQRPPWETNQVLREELTTIVSNRSAAYFDLADYISALADAETVISVRRNWPKGHFRKAKALLGLGRPREAAEAVKLGLSYEPQNSELLAFLADIDRAQQRLDERRLGSKADAAPAAVPAAA